MLEETPDTFKVECPVCDGTGMIYTECCECGNEKEEGCEICDEDGRVTWAELDSRARNNYCTVARYTIAVAADLKAVSEFCGRPFEPMMVDAGFAVYCDIGDKKPRYNFTGARA